MITIYYHCFDTTPDDEIFVAGALKELAQHLKVDPKDDPIKLSVSIKRLGDEPDLAKEVDRILIKFGDPSYTFSRCAADILYLFSKFDLITENFSAKLLVYCSSDSQIAQTAKSEATCMKKPPPEWGATCWSFSAAYPPKDQLKRKFTIWHEALHLLGLDECYDENTLRRKCKCKTCVMQYKPPLGVDENWPSRLCDNLCGRQKRKLKNLANKVAKVEKGKRSS